MKIYTRAGDAGETGLFGGVRISKASEKVDAYGEIDELNSVLGVARTEPIGEPWDALLADLQSRLFDLGAELANGKPEKDLGIPLVGDEDVSAMEAAIDRAETELEPQKSFVLPGGTRAAAHLHVARCVCRRAERRVVALAEHTPVRGEVLRFLNRLSDLLFVLARVANVRGGVADVPWLGRKRADV